MSYRINPKALVQQRYTQGEPKQSFLGYAKEQLGNADFDPEAIVIAVSIEGRILYLNLMAAIAMEWAVTDVPSSAFAKTLSGLFDVDEDRAREDIEGAAATLAEKGLLVEAAD